MTPKRKAGSDTETDEETTEKPIKPAAKKRQGKTLSGPKKRAAKDKAKDLVRTRVARLRPQRSLLAFGDKDVITAPAYTVFPRPAGAKVGSARGCRTASITIGPRIGVETNTKSDADSDLPHAIKDVKRRYPGYGWVAGHVINADFGGDGTLNANMTCLTSSANGTNKAFDEPVKKARKTLHDAYSLMRQCGAQDTFFNEQEYGIKITAELSEDTWSENYPGNCISNSMQLNAEIVGEPSGDELRAVMTIARGPSLEKDIEQVEAHMDRIRELIQEANDDSLVENEKLEDSDVEDSEED